MLDSAKKFEVDITEKASSLKERFAECSRAIDQLLDPSAKSFTEYQILVNSLFLAQRDVEQLLRRINKDIHVALSRKK